MRRLLIRIVVLLAIGAVLNVLVAWGLTLRPQGIWNGPSTQADSWPVAVPPNWPEPYSHENAGGIGVDFETFGTHDFGIGPWATVLLTRAGWPVRSVMCVDLWYCGGLRAPTTYESRGAIGWPPSPRNFRNPFPVPLPVRPLPLGFAVNMLFYAALVWLPFAGIAALRRRSRRRRGVCIHCAYPIGTAEVCTECGRPVRPEMANGK